MRSPHRCQALQRATQLAGLFEAKGWDALGMALPALKERAKTVAELIGQALFIVARRPLTLDDKARKLMDADGQAILTALTKRFEDTPDWSAAALEALVRTYAEETGTKLGKVAQPLAFGPHGADGFAARFRRDGGARA